MKPDFELAKGRSLESYIWYPENWRTPATDYPESKEGDFRIHHSKYTRGMYPLWGIDGYLFFKATKPWPLVRLQERVNGKWKTWMIDDPPQWRAMQIYAEQAKGKVLTTGLGLGLYLQAMKGNQNVESVTVVERSKEVIRLVEPYLPTLPGLVIVVKDFYEFIKNSQTIWDTILVDLWVTRDKKEEMIAYWLEVLPLAIQLRRLYPKASLTFHGFQTLSDVKPVSEEMEKLACDLDI